MKINNNERIWITAMMIITIPHFLKTLNAAARYSIFFVAAFFVQEMHLWFTKKANGRMQAKWKTFVFIILFYVAAAAYSVSPNIYEGLIFLSAAGALSSVLKDDPYGE